MEGTHRQLCTRLTDGLRRNNADCLADLDCLAGCHIRTVALCADPDMGTAGKHVTNLYGCICARFLNLLCCYDSCGASWRNHMICFYNHIAVIIINRLTGATSRNTLFQTFNDFLAVVKRLNPHARNFFVLTAAVYLVDNQLLRNVYETTGQVTGVRGTKRGIGKSLSCAVCGNEILEYVKTFTEVGLNRELNRTSRRIRHKTTHTGKLLNLLIGASRTGLCHHGNIVIRVQPV